ncbi:MULTISPECIES: TadE/TadG family type IV pilus assembly protein [unclassified Rhizobium]|uniref:TadE/TadG family type IV pilus assembly protein n=1 Tax=unclassified Rhizobium TaxID=2613769 RepID=UPI00119BB9BB|nr:MULTISPECIES: TadE/TadG family type IV pilus assembly protein [unclassified Rhizobium]MBB3290767.1 Flp pilus assembly protein TadG [Rhizobium sp. BK252]MBB3405547.1 Flp pilus assembly protein TadG [Rhizobium sp. BK289]MBB3418163.1 Flp pilus assembly protein TadG [Rhizobium sp. BK284]MBB3486042.1 Flp pilus assembly protein TadG [Rhizobium sp. BK347]
MTPDNAFLTNIAPARPRARSGLRELLRSRDGAAAIEFAMLAIPYFLIVFAIIETFVAFTAEQVVSNAVDTLARQIRTGQITADPNKTSYTTSQQFRQAFCNEIAVLITCSASELQTPANLYLDVESYSSFASMPTTIPRKSSTDPYSDLNTSGFTFAPGGAKSLNMVRAYYRWQVITDLLRPYLTNVRPTDGSASVYLIVATAAFQNENYP